MKTLLILRHAKAQPQAERMTDHNRPLAPRGEAQSPRVGQWLVEHQLVPQRIFSSTALRAQQTAERVAEACGGPTTVELFESLYLASPDTYVNLLREESGDAERVLVVGHNPTLDELLFQLAGEHEGFSTAGLAVVELAIETWDDLYLPTKHRLVKFVRP